MISRVFSALALSCLLVACGGRLVNPPAGYKLGAKEVTLTAQKDVPDFTSDAPLLSIVNANRLEDVAKSVDFVQLTNKVLQQPQTIPAALRANLSDGRTRQELVLSIQVKTVNVMQPVVGADWWLRYNIVGTLVDTTANNKELWKYELREAVGSQIQGHKLRGLSTDQMVADNGVTLKGEIATHLSKSINIMFADLQKALSEAGGGS